MNDTFDDAVRAALRDIIATAPTTEHAPTPVDLIDEIDGEHGRRPYLLVAAVVVIAVGVVGLLAITTRHTGTNNPTAPSTSEPRQRSSGEITDPHSIDFSPWLTGAPEWPGYQPDYLIFDLDALEGWTKVDEWGGHRIGDGWSYTWSATVRDPDGHEFSLLVTDSLRNGAVPSGNAVDINGAEGVVNLDGVFWLIDEVHWANVAGMGAVDSERALALAQALTTTRTTRLSAGELGSKPEIKADPTAEFSGVIDGYTWSASATSNGTTFIVDRTIRGGTTDSATAISQVGNNDLCVFVTGYLPDADTTPHLVLSDGTTISLPTQLLSDGEYWFAACVPYALDATSVEIDSPNANPSLHRLNWPMLIPTLGELPTDTDLPNNRLAELFAALPGAPASSNACGTLLTDQTQMVASGPRADGNRLELWATPTSNGKLLVVLLQMRHNGANLGGGGGCGDRVQPDTWASAQTDSIDGHSDGNVDVFGRTEPSATQVRVTFTSGRVVVADVQTDGYFVASLIDSPSAYQDVLWVEPID